MDISGTMQGAGGVGGLLAVNQDGGVFYPAFDGNGNVTEYINAIGGVVAHYEYDAFGNTVSFSGTKAADFAYRFSTKPLDLTTGWLYYGYRFYDPLTGRWPSKDPIGESGGVNLYGFLRNDPSSWIDRLGWEPISSVPPRAPNVQTCATCHGTAPGYVNLAAGLRDAPEPSTSQLSHLESLVDPSSPSIRTDEEGCEELRDAIRMANAAMNRGKCKKWFSEHSSFVREFTVHCYGGCLAWFKTPCVRGDFMWTNPNYVNGRIAVCLENLRKNNASDDVIASLLIHEVAHYYGRKILRSEAESDAESAQAACGEEL
jgi:RHS repeat-associated protein